ncbi:SDR family oxidoreductase [uncultured Chitinophaga sp.]|jgi:Predicted nucleoside-diphosphate-sugar epimerases|uniref:SDR family oxidoreductase n=1 Tax=uncultured Chitinophaga sp. TaxID=339340 RepID=UPI0026065314|nr:SDR family oxidoreductase [uncultured Chitinophaga sp.]
MILVTCATGHLGQATLNFLVKKVPAGSVAALVRDLSKGESLKSLGVSLRPGDYNDPASLATAFKGVETLLLISSGSMENRLQQHINAIDAARANGVKHIIYTGVLKSKPDSKFTAGIDHYHTEEYLKKSGLSYTVFRNTYYTEVLPVFMGNALTTGQWYYAAGEAKANFASRTDMAEALANVLAEPAKHVNKIYEITGNKAHALSEIAAIVSGITGKQLNYIPVSLEELEAGMKKAGIPEHYISVMAGVAGSLGAGEFDAEDPALEQLLGRKPEEIGVTLGKVLAEKV